MMANTQWKPFQPPNNHQNEINPLPIERSSPPFSSSSSFKKSNSPNQIVPSNTSISLGENYTSSNEFTETGIVEKLLPTYGFIQCCERQARLFFHFSQYAGNPQHLKLGDAVEFETIQDQRTGKPVACLVNKIGSPAICEELSAERVSGFITTEVSGEREGRVAYENRGECFFLPFTAQDLDDPDNILKAKDRVTFQIATDKSGALRARHICLESPSPERYFGVIRTLKDSFGFIERADVIKEIFFHASESREFKSLNVGDEVEFSIQTRFSQNGKDVAVNVDRLPNGTVVFKDISNDTYSGRIVRTVRRHGSYNKHASSNNTFESNDTRLPGKIVYEDDGGKELEVSFDEKGFKREYTIQEGDWVTFNIVTDRRDKLSYATNIVLASDNFEKIVEKRERGYVCALKDSYGFINSRHRPSKKIYFKFSELLYPDFMVELSDKVEFTVITDPIVPRRLQAIRIMPLGMQFFLKRFMVKDMDYDNSTTNGFDTLYCSDPNNDANGLGTQEFSLIDLNTDLSTDIAPQSYDNFSNGEQSNTIKSNTWSQILCQLPIKISSQENEETSQLIDLFSTGEDSSPVLKPTIEYHKEEEGERNKNGSKVGMSSAYQDSEDRSDMNDDTRTKFANKHKNAAIRTGKRGFIVALKQGFGFIEDQNHIVEFFFNINAFIGRPQSLEIGQEVKFTTIVENSKRQADWVSRLPNGTLCADEPGEEILNGRVKRTVRCFNPDQKEYMGLIAPLEINTDGETVEKSETYEFSMTSLIDFHDFIQEGDLVTFSLGYCSHLVRMRALRVKPVRSRFQATVDTIKGRFGFLNYEVEEEKKLFFHMSEVRDSNTHLRPGDLVEFSVIRNQRNGKSSACSVVKLSDAITAPRPERLMTRIKSLVDECMGPRVILIRQPRGPDGTKGFCDRE